MTWKVAKKIALSILRGLWRLTSLEGSVIGVVTYMMVMEWDWKRDEQDEEEQIVDSGLTTTTGDGLPRF